MLKPKWILLGQIAGAHGIKGELLVKTFTGAPEDIASYGPLADETGTHSIDLEVVRVTDKGVIARIAGIADRTAAEQMKGLALHVARDRLPLAADNEFYHADLIGLAAVSPNGQPIGEIVAVQNYGAGDLIEICLTGTARTELVPFTDAFVPSVDLTARKAVVVVPVLAEDDEGDAPEG